MRLTAEQARELSYNESIKVDEVVDYILRLIKVNAIRGIDKLKVSFDDIVDEISYIDFDNIKEAAEVLKKLGYELNQIVIYSEYAESRGLFISWKDPEFIPF